MVDKYTDLLGGNQTFAQVATSLLQDQRSKNKKNRKKQKQALLAGALLSAFDYNKLNNVAKNLEQASVDQQFDIANKAQEWEAYSTYVQDDKQYKQAGGKQKTIKDAEGNDQEVINDYFKSKSTLIFNELNPNFDAQYAGRSQRLGERQTEIERVAKQLEEQHLNKSGILNLQPAAYNLDAKQYEEYKKIIPSEGNYLTKEEFYKPYNDYYRNKERRIVDPSERSAVHALFGLFGPSRKRRENLDAKLAQEELIITKLNNQYEQVSSLIDPLTVSYTDPDEFEYKQGEAILYAMDEKNIPQTLLRENLVRKLKRPKYANGLTPSQLNSLVITSTINFDELVAQRKKAQQDFKLKYKQTFAGNELEQLPFSEKVITIDGKEEIKRTITNKDKYEEYVILENIYIDEELKIGTQTSRDLRNALTMLDIEKKKLQENQNPDMILYYESVISDATDSDVATNATDELMKIRSSNANTKILLNNYEAYLTKNQYTDEVNISNASDYYIEMYISNNKKIKAEIKEQATK